MSSLKQHWNQFLDQFETEAEREAAKRLMQADSCIELSKSLKEELRATAESGIISPSSTIELPGNPSTLICSDIIIGIEQLVGTQDSAERPGLHCFGIFAPKKGGGHQYTWGTFHSFQIKFADQGLYAEMELQAEGIQGFAETVADDVIPSMSLLVSAAMRDSREEILFAYLLLSASEE